MTMCPMKMSHLEGPLTSNRNFYALNGVEYQ